MRSLAALLLACAAAVSVAADWQDVAPNVFSNDDPRAKDLPQMMGADARKRMQEANRRESKLFAEVKTKQQWEKYRDERLQKLKASLGTFPEVPKNMRVKVTRRIDGDGFVIHNLLYESRPGLWVSANLYLPAQLPDQMPGIIIAHAHHTPKTHGELQDMGMTWARTGTAVLIPDHLGHGERRTHNFITDKDYHQPFRVSRQDYYFRYNTNLQLAAIGDSLMGWMVWDLMRGIDVLLMQKNIDKDRILMLGAVAGGGDPAGVTAALDPRIAGLIPFNFGGWQPESAVLDHPDRDFAWFGDGYWESTRGLRYGARDGFAHFVIVGIAPRKLIYAHEFAWDAQTDPAWPRLQKIFDFYNARDSLRVAHGSGTVRASGPGNTHCTHVGAIHRTMIYPALKDWFGMPIPKEYSQRLPTAELMCWTDEARKELQPKKLHEILQLLAVERSSALAKQLAGLDQDRRQDFFRQQWQKQLGSVEPFENPKVTEGKTEDVPGGTLARFILEVEPGILVPMLLITPKDAKGKSPVVVMVAQGGKAGFLKNRSDVIDAFLQAGVVVCLPDVRGTGETQPGTSAERGSSRTTVSQTNLILGRTIIGMQVCDLRTVVRWLKTRDAIDGTKVALWGDSFAKVNAAEGKFAHPLDVANPHALSEPGAGAVVSLTSVYEPAITAVYTRGQLDTRRLFESAYLYYPHDAIVPGLAHWANWSHGFAVAQAVQHDGMVDGLNRPTGAAPRPPVAAAKWVIANLKK